jgi:hypothetical protein
MHTPQALIGEAAFLAGAGTRILRVYRRAAHCSRNRTHTEKKRDWIDANRFISSRSGDNDLAAPCGQRFLSVGIAATFLEPLFLRLFLLSYHVIHP